MARVGESLLKQTTWAVEINSIDEGDRNLQDGGRIAGEKIEVVVHDRETLVATLSQTLCTDRSESKHATLGAGADHSAHPESRRYW